MRFFAHTNMLTLLFVGLWSHSFVRAAKTYFLKTIYHKLILFNSHVWSPPLIRRRIIVLPLIFDIIISNICYLKALSLVWDVYHIKCDTASQISSALEHITCNFSCFLFIQCQACTKIRFEFQIFILSTDAALEKLSH